MEWREGDVTGVLRLPEALVAEIEAEARRRGVSRADVVRERLSSWSGPGQQRPVPPDAIVDLIGSVSGLPADLSSRKKDYLRETGYGRRRHR